MLLPYPPVTLISHETTEIIRSTSPTVFLCNMFHLNDKHTLVSVETLLQFFMTEDGGTPSHTLKSTRDIRSFFTSKPLTQKFRCVVLNIYPPTKAPRSKPLLTSRIIKAALNNLGIWTYGPVKQDC